MQVERLRDLDDLPSIFVLPVDNVVDSLLIPALQVADGYRCMVGFFDSGALRSLGPGLASYIRRSSATVRLLASPVISDRDREAIELASADPAERDARIQQTLGSSFSQLIADPTTLESALASHTLSCLAYLLATERLELRLVYVRGGGIFHLKVWIFSDGDEILVANGSNNLTNRALSTNVEQVRVERSWKGGGESDACVRFAAEFDAYWENTHDHALAVDAPEAARRDLLQRYPDLEAPTERDYFDALVADGFRSFVEPLAPKIFDGGHELQIPSYLEFESGPFAHQGAAVEAWLSNGCQGVLELATGAGKTITSLIAACKVVDRELRLIVVVAVPSRPLVDQWVEDVRTFGLEPVVPGMSSTRAGKLEQVASAVRRARYGSDGAACLVVTHDLLVDDEFQDLLEGVPVKKMLIGDEMHRLGRPKFLASPPTCFDYHLGLSATPDLQYRPDASDELSNFFGGVVFRFGLEDAIGKCLVPYDYFIQPVELTQEEADRWLELTADLRRRGFRGDDDSGLDDAMSALLAQRRAVLEQAEGKVEILRGLLVRAGPSSLRHTLIYSSDKGPEQHDQVNELLLDLGIVAHQLTQEETGRPALVASLLRRFADGDLQVLTAKRVLDEGVNIPEVQRAYLLASTTMERQWVQRRGRILRQCKRTGKTSAELHDFLVLPPDDNTDPDLQRMVRGEMARLTTFAELSRNSGDSGGPLEILYPLADRYLV